MLAWIQKSNLIQNRPFSHKSPVGAQSFPPRQAHNPANNPKYPLGEKLLVKRPPDNASFKCYHCNAQGHTARNCPKRAKPSHSVNQVTLNDTADGIRVPLMINDEKFFALLDTGAERTCLDICEARRMELELTPFDGEVFFAGTKC